MMQVALFCKESRRKDSRKSFCVAVGSRISLTVAEGPSGTMTLCAFTFNCLVLRDVLQRHPAITAGLTVEK